MAHHDPQLWRRHKARKQQQQQGTERPYGREAAAMRQKRQRLRALRDRMRGAEEIEYRL